MSQWDETPNLVGDVVRLEPLQPHHAEGLLAASDDDEVFTWQTFHRPTTLAEAAALIDLYLGRPNTRSWAQVDQASAEVAGLTTFYDIDPARRTVAIGSTWLGRRFWRTGINTESKLLLLRHAFDELGCARVVWHVDIKNERSQAAVDRIGGVREGVLRKHIIRRDGSWRDTVLYSMIDDEWPAARDALELKLTTNGKVQT
jgi:RimJ/RimL family protein N-acetyltransferase